MVYWLIFSVAIALVPFGAGALRLMTLRPSTTFISIITELMGRGELLGISVGISAGAIGRLLSGNKRMGQGKRCLASAGLIVLMLSLSYSMDVAAWVRAAVSFHRLVVAEVSLFFYFLALVTSTISIYAEE